MECALWYWSHGSVRYELYEDEDAAARGAVFMADDGDYGFPAGVQRADGAYTQLDEWDAYKAENQRQWDRALEEVRKERSQPRPATRRISPPFDTKYDETVIVPADAPLWLGRQVASRSGE